VKTGTAWNIGAGGGAAGRSAAETLDTAAVERAVAASRLRIRVFMSNPLVCEDPQGKSMDQWPRRTIAKMQHFADYV
jgi:hypothetical protein